jgi:hypothetical protein
MTFKLAIIIAIAAALSACVEAPPPAKGNAKVRVLKWFATNATRRCRTKPIGIASSMES